MNLYQIAVEHANRRINELAIEYPDNLYDAVDDALANRGTPHDRYDHGYVDTLTNFLRNLEAEREAFVQGDADDLAAWLA